MAKYKILREITGYGYIKGESLAPPPSVKFKAGTTVTGVEVDNPSYIAGMPGGPAAKALSIQTDKGMVYISNNSSLGPNGLNYQLSNLQPTIDVMPAKQDTSTSVQSTSGSGTTGTFDYVWLFGALAGGVLVVLVAKYKYPKLTNSQWFMAAGIGCLLGAVSVPAVRSIMKK